MPDGEIKRSITFAKKGSQLEEDYMIPCGKCKGCLASKKLDWAIRMYHESTCHEYSSFVTMTYADAPDRLDYEHVRLFLKKLRKRIPVRYFITGEYGEQTHRPHYHAVIFGADFRGGSYDIDGRMWGNHILNRIWRHGDCVVGDFTMASACYVAGYVSKKLDDPDTFTIMSRRPPLGYNWAVQNRSLLQRREKVIVEGQELPIPKAYLNWADCSAFRPIPVDLESAKANRRGTYYTPQELRNKERNHAAKDREKKEKI